MTKIEIHVHSHRHIFGSGDSGIGEWQRQGTEPGVKKANINNVITKYIEN